MLKWMKGIVAPLAVAALSCLMPLAAQADSVQYHTVVTFTASGPNSTLGPSNTLTGIADPSDVLTAVSIPVGSSATLVPLGGVLPISFGSFTMTGNSVAVFSGAQIKIDVWQDGTTPPAVGDTGTSTFIGSALATFVTPPPGTNPLDNIVLNITSATSFTLPAGAGGFPPHVIYTIDGTQTITPNDSTGQFGHKSISGNVAEQQDVPLPSTASIGLVLLGGLGGASMLRRRRLVVA